MKIKLLSLVLAIVLALGFCVPRLPLPRECDTDVQICLLSE